MPGCLLWTGGGLEALPLNFIWPKVKRVMSRPVTEEVIKFLRVGLNPVSLVSL